MTPSRTFDTEMLEEIGAWARREMDDNPPGSVPRIRGGVLLALVAEHVELQAESLTPLEARALRMASIFGTPDPTPPEIASAWKKLKAVEGRTSPVMPGEPDEEY